MSWLADEAEASNSKASGSPSMRLLFPVSLLVTLAGGKGRLELLLGPLANAPLLEFGAE